jgi:regulator of ribonuclease activity A
VTTTADLLDEHGDRATVCELQLRRFGGADPFSGAIQTVQCFEDNVLLRQLLSTPGEGRVLVVDGGGSLRCALLGDQVATLGRDNGWAGVVLNGAVRDAAALRDVGLGVDALGTCPRRSSKTGEGQVGVPLEFGGITFRPGDVLASDEDGVVVLPGTSSAT